MANYIRVKGFVILETRITSNALTVVQKLLNICPKPSCSENGFCAYVNIEQSTNNFYNNSLNGQVIKNIFGNNEKRNLASNIIITFNGDLRNRNFVEVVNEMKFLFRFLLRNVRKYFLKTEHLEKNGRAYYHENEMGHGVISSYKDCLDLIFYDDYEGFILDNFTMKRKYFKSIIPERIY